MTMKTKGNYSIRVMIVNWIEFSLSPFLIILINSLTLFQIFPNIPLNSGALISSWQLIGIFLFDVLLLSILNYFGNLPLAFHYLTKSASQKKIESIITVLLGLSITAGALFTALTNFSKLSGLFLSIPEIMVIPWLIYLSYKTIKSQNIHYFVMMVTIETLFTALLLNNFYGISN